ncbi:4-(cytidine 5'-diphospho)-2-C-methyl-D-erythritol kinase [Prochlorococcus sp. MIT 1307]|uniref:4-(cytidine 5'-diphospho)-2-C-methyl-D-erythritol kinase n=1 Tax=Prochlorococcus sp. MIT 1307 TaxID=3096219 RepID=UPI002A761D3C|nr:4-(cytidine 5'-diphospho)-2-C-methyl-D-erythritol kinase [Prochlorococcus sp. MIT 1307]
MSTSYRPFDTGHLLRIKAPAKINLHLEVLGLRADGFHELAMVMQSIDLADYLEITRNEDGEINLSVDDPNLSTGDDNLIIKAARLIRDNSGVKGLGANIHLCKKIPIGAGLAGGSSDGAATLFGLNSLWGLAFTRKKLISLAAELGSDIPFCLEGGTQLCFGRGEKLESLKACSPFMAVILIKDPSVSVSTPWAYGRCREIRGAHYLESESDFERCRQQLRDENWLKNWSISEPPPLKNDLQKVVAPEISSVQNGLELLSELPGSLGVAMSGSGPSCFALYSSYNKAKDVFDQNRERLSTSGLESWCCSFQPQGVTSES